MPEDPLPVVQGMVDYLYTGSYDDKRSAASDEIIESTSAAKYNARMFALADKYQIDDLQTLSVRKYSNAIGERCVLNTFFESVPDVYLTTPDTARALRDAALSFARCHLGTSLQIPDIQMAFDKVSMDVPDFARELLNSFLKAPVRGSCSTCGPHQPMEILQCRCKTCGKGGGRIED